MLTAEEVDKAAEEVDKAAADVEEGEAASFYFLISVDYVFIYLYDQT